MELSAAAMKPTQKSHSPTVPMVFLITSARWSMLKTS
jgi:hypothetical protein